MAHLAGDQWQSEERVRLSSTVVAVGSLLVQGAAVVVGLSDWSRLWWLAGLACVTLTAWCGTWVTVLVRRRRRDVAGLPPRWLALIDGRCIVNPRRPPGSGMVGPTPGHLYIDADGLRWEPTRRASRGFNVPTQRWDTSWSYALSPVWGPGQQAHLRLRATGHADVDLRAYGRRRLARHLAVRATQDPAP